VFHLDKELQQRQWRKRQLELESNDFVIEFFAIASETLTAIFWSNSVPLLKTQCDSVFHFLGFSFPRLLKGTETG
jgi:hypothetical protein